MHVHSLIATFGFVLVASTNAHSVRHTHPRRALQVSQPPAKWSYSGCYTDSTSARGLSSYGTASDDMTEIKCIEICDQKGYSYAGTEYSKECFCGYQIQSTSVKAAESTCNMACAGDSTAPCGGPDRLTIFTNGVAPPVENPGVLGYKSLGCYTDSQTERTLSEYEPTSDNIVFVRSCVETCLHKGFSYAGVEYGQECYCGNAIQNGNKPTSSSACNMPCTGNRTELCGGSNAINLYQAVSSSSSTTVSSTTSTKSSTSTLSTMSTTTFTSSTSSVTSSVTTTSTSRPYCKYNNPSGGLLTDAGFEESYGPWSASFTSGQGSIAVQPNDYAYGGCSELTIQPTSTSGYIGFRLTQNISTTLVPGQAYLVSFYQGRRTPSDTDSTPPTIDGYLGQTYFGYATACQGTGCTLSGQYGIANYTYLQFPVTYQGGGQTLQIRVVYSGSPPYAPLLFDNFYLKAVSN